MTKAASRSPRSRVKPQAPWDKNVSPVGWHLVSYLQRFVESRDNDNEDDQKRFLSWENTVLVRAENMDHAYDKAMKIARLASTPYRGGPDGVPVQWRLVGITDVLPIYEEIEDGAEIAWIERAPRKLQNLKRMVRPRGTFRQ